MNSSATHIFLLLLLVTVGGAVLQQQTVLQPNHSDAVQLEATQQCQQLAHSSIDRAEDTDPHFDHESHSNTSETSSIPLTSCNSLVNTLPSENDFSFSPGVEEFNITIYNALLSSQTFVFQEPDPPRLG
ncbi:MAG: hypothetical protein ACQEST_11805 [Bacteroidota bacterium]